MTTFGQQLRAYRRQCQDPMRKGTLTQVRLGELLGDELGDAGYSGAAVSDWERDRSKINADDRLVLVSLIAVLNRCGGLHTLDEANQFLQSGNYRALDAHEQSPIFPDTIGEANIIAEVREPLPPPELTQERRKQLILLEKVRQFWVEGVLEKSVQGALLLNLASSAYDQAVNQPWQHVIGSLSPLPDNQETAVSTNSRSAVAKPVLLPLFHQSDRALLILGEPGSGKTTTLISFAKELIEQAEQDTQQPIPVIFNMVSWAEKREKLSSWLVEELTAKYQIPHTLGKQWLKDDALVLLLDGLDEVPMAHREACIMALNQFREEHGLTGLVVNSRREQYEALETNLNMGNAILLQPLTTQQIDAYLAAAGTHLAGLRTAVQQDAALREIAQTPLTLHVLSAAYWQMGDVADEEVGVDINSVFGTYVQAMFARRGDSATYSQAEVMRGLNWLSLQMDKHNQALFLIEQLQPSWLRANRWKFVYVMGSRLFAGLVAGILMWLFWLMVRINIAQFGTEWSARVAEVQPGPAAETDLWLMLFLGLLMGLVTAVMDSIGYKIIGILEYPTFNKRKIRHWRTAVTTIVTGILGTLIIGIFDIPFLALSFGVVVGVTFGLITYFVYGLNMRNDIRTVAALDWTWQGALTGLLIGIGLTTLVELIEWTLYGTTEILRTYLSLGLVFTLLGGLRGHRLSKPNKPNQGIRLSATNALTASGVLGLVMTVITAVLWENVTLGLVAGLLSLLVTMFMYGGGNVINHFYLRFLLWLTNDSPPRLIQFLEFCVDRVFLHRVGGGYLFIHPLLQEYFASQFPRSHTKTD